MFLPRITQVELNSKSYIRERGVGQALFALKEEQGKSFHVNARVIPLCPMTAKVVPRNLHSKVVPIMQLFEVFCWFPKGGSQGIGKSWIQVLANSGTSQPIPIVNVASQVINTEWKSAQKLRMHSLHLSQQVRKSRFASACWVSCPFLCYSIW